MIPYAKFFARARVTRCTSAYACVDRRSSHEDERGLAREPRARRLRPLREDVPVRRLERVERSEPAAREEPDRATEPPADPRAQHVARTQQRRRALRLEAKQRAQLVARPVERGIAEARAGPRAGR